MAKKSLYLILDTETCGSIAQPLIYDIAWVICDRKGHIVGKRNFLVEEILTDWKRMKSAYYAEKLVTFYAGASITRLPFSSILDVLAQDLAYVDCISAYNLGFDLRAIKCTAKETDQNIDNLFADRNMLDLWLFACSTILQQKSFKKCAAGKPGSKTAKGNWASNAQVAYRYITNNWSFVEQHTALDDCLIEAQILAACFRSRQRIPFNQINSSPWKLIQD